MATRIGPRKSPTSPRPPVSNPGAHQVFVPIARFARRLAAFASERRLVVRLVGAWKLSARVLERLFGSHQEIGRLITEVLDGLAKNGEEGNGAVEAAVKAKATALCTRFPIYT